MAGHPRNGHKAISGGTYPQGVEGAGMASPGETFILIEPVCLETLWSLWIPLAMGVWEGVVMDSLENHPSAVFYPFGHPMPYAYNNELHFCFLGLVDVVVRHDPPATMTELRNIVEDVPASLTKTKFVVLRKRHVLKCTFLYCQKRQYHEFHFMY
jgi:hypothetical protein